MSATPELKPFGDLLADDFDRSPVWINVHMADYGEPWYDDTDEETFRPHSGTLPVDPSDGMYLVASTAALADGTVLPGFLTPGIGATDPGIMQPHVFVGGRRFGFWGGLFGVPEAVQDAFLATLGKQTEQVFPARVQAQAGLTTGVADIEVPGWLKMSR